MYAVCEEFQSGFSLAVRSICQLVRQLTWKALCSLLEYTSHCVCPVVRREMESPNCFTEVRTPFAVASWLGTLWCLFCGFWCFPGKTKGNKTWKRNVELNVCTCAVTTLFPIFSNKGGSRFFRICRNQNWPLSKVFSKAHLSPHCIILHVLFKICLNQRIFTQYYLFGLSGTLL